MPNKLRPLTCAVCRRTRSVRRAVRTGPEFCSPECFRKARARRLASAKRAPPVTAKAGDPMLSAAAMWREPRTLEEKRAHAEAIGLPVRRLPPKALAAYATPARKAES